MTSHDMVHGDQSHGQHLNNETLLNVAALLREPVGSTRSYRLHLDTFPLTEETTAENIDGTVRLTRLRDSIMVDVRATGRAVLACVRCLREYPQPFRTKFSEEFHQTVDLRTGVPLDMEAPLSDDDATIDESHQLDLAEVLRQEILLALPMRPECGPDCPGPDVTEVGETAPVDERLAALSKLLDNDSEAS